MAQVLTARPRLTAFHGRTGSLQKTPSLDHNVGKIQSYDQFIQNTQTIGTFAATQELKYIQIVMFFMSESQQITVAGSGVSKIALFALALVFAAGLFVVGFDNGHIVNFVFAQGGVDPLVIHEFTHDMRHAAGFPCH